MTQPKYPREWEHISESSARLKVFGGWVINNNNSYMKMYNSDDINMAESMCFIPDPDHQWILEDEK